MAAGVDFRQQLRDHLSKLQRHTGCSRKDWLRPAANGRARLEDAGDYVRIEVEESLRRGMLVIPVLVGDAAMPSPEALPESIRELSYRHATRLRPNPDFRHDVARLIETLRGGRSSKQKSRRRWLIGSTASVFIAVLVIFAFWMKPAQQANRDIAQAGTSTVDNGLAAQAPAPRELTAKEQELLDSLSEPTSVDFSDTALADVLEYLKALSGVKVLVDPRSDLDPSSPVTLSLESATLRSVLLAALDELDATLVIRHELLYVVLRGDEREDDLPCGRPGERGNPGRRLVMRVNSLLSWAEESVKADPFKILDALKPIRADVGNATDIDSRTKTELIQRIDTQIKTASEKADARAVRTVHAIIENAPATMADKLDTTVEDLESARRFIEQRGDLFANSNELVAQIDKLLLQARHAQAQANQRQIDPAVREAQTARYERFRQADLDEEGRKNSLSSSENRKSPTTTAESDDSDPFAAEPDAGVPISSLDDKKQWPTRLRFWFSAEGTRRLTEPTTRLR